MKKTIVFDLDDTLYKEIEYLKSAYNYICSKIGLNIFEEMMQLYFQEEDVFESIINKYSLNIDKKTIIDYYRNHFPNLSLDAATKELLYDLKEKGHFLGIITDGRSLTQRNKLKALQIEKIFDLIIISEEIGTEKPDINNFLPFYGHNSTAYFYVGDNINKDFLGPNTLNWTTIQLLDNGLNIRRKRPDLDKSFYPKYQIKTLRALKQIIGC